MTFEDHSQTNKVMRFTVCQSGVVSDILEDGAKLSWTQIIEFGVSG